MRLLSSASQMRRLSGSFEIGVRKCRPERSKTPIWLFFSRFRPPENVVQKPGFRGPTPFFGTFFGDSWPCQFRGSRMGLPGARFPTNVWGVPFFCHAWARDENAFERGYQNGVPERGFEKGVRGRADCWGSVYEGLSPSLKEINERGSHTPKVNHRIYFQQPEGLEREGIVNLESQMRRHF